MNIKELIKKLLGEGKTVQEIVIEVAKHEEAIAQGLKTDAIIKEVKSLEAAVKAEKEFLALQEQEQKDSEFTKKVDEAVNARLKVIGTPNTSGKKYKFFNRITGLIEEKTYETEGQELLQKMLTAFSEKKFGEAANISAKIGEYNQKNDFNFAFNQDQKTALYSDATTGSYLIPTEVNMQIMALSYKKSVMLQRVNKAAINYNSKVYPIIIDGTFAFIADETTQVGDKTPTIGNPTFASKRYGGMTYVSNHLLKLRGADLTAAFIESAASAQAKFLDLMIAAGSVTTESDGFNGIIFDANTAYLSAISLSAIDKDTLVTLANELSPSCDPASLAFIANRKVKSKFGLLENSNGAFIFPEYYRSGEFSPMGIPFITNSQIPSTINHAASAGTGSNTRAAGDDDVIVVADLSKIVVGMGDLRIDSSEHFKFDYDQFSFRFIGEAGSKVLSSGSTAGKVAVVQQLNG